MPAGHSLDGLAQSDEGFLNMTFDRREWHKLLASVAARDF
jgi:hypothetical protein